MNPTLKDSIDLNNLPAHIAVIMDGNGRWAKQKGFADRIFGHRNAIAAVRETIEGCGELGVKYLTLYAFSTENWNRPASEVKALMSLLVSAIHDELPGMMKNQVRLKTIGDIKALPATSQKELLNAIDQTAQNTGLTLVLALSYSGKWDIVEAGKRLAEKVQSGELKAEEINAEMVILCCGNWPMRSYTYLKICFGQISENHICIRRLWIFKCGNVDSAKRVNKLKVRAKARI